MSSPPAVGVEPVVSVVVATFNRSALVGRLVGALAAQEGAPTFEVVVVDDGSTDETAATVRLAMAVSNLDAAVVTLERNRGPAAARNAGWRHTRGSVIAFTDDDCIPDVRWLHHLTAAMGTADLVQGRTVPNPDQAPDGLFSWAPENAAEGPFYETCNIAYRRSALESVDGFDESFTTSANRRRPRGRYVAPRWGEDTDLALRAKAAGGRSAFAADAVVWHDRKPGGLADRLADMPRRLGSVALVARHPALREQFDTPWFVDRAHMSVVAAMASTVLALLARGRPLPRALAVAALTVWAVQRGGPYARRRWWRVLPQWLLSDVAEIGVLAAGSIRYRTLLL